MNRTRDEFIERWADRLIGMALKGLVADTDEAQKGPASCGAFARKLPEKIERLLGTMWDDLAKDNKPIAAQTPKDAKPATPTRTT